jgi:hypothetical protein
MAKMMMDEKAMPKKTGGKPVGKKKPNPYLTMFEKK